MESCYCLLVIKTAQSWWWRLCFISWGFSCQPCLLFFSFPSFFLFLFLSFLLFSESLFSFCFSLSISNDFVSPFFFFLYVFFTFFQDIFLSLNNDIVGLMFIFLSGVKLVDDLLIEPWWKLGVKFSLKWLSEESLWIKDFICVIFEMFEILFWENSSYNFFLSCAFLFIGFSVL